MAAPAGSDAVVEAKEVARVGGSHKVVRIRRSPAPDAADAADAAAKAAAAAKADAKDATAAAHTHEPVASGPVTIDVAGTEEAPLRFLVCGDFSYPLVGQPVLRSGPGDYVLPSGTGDSFGVSFAEGTDMDQLDHFDRVLSAFAELAMHNDGGQLVAADVPEPLQVEDAALVLAAPGEGGGGGGGGELVPAGEGKEGEGISAKVAKGITYTGSAIAAGAITGARYAGAGLKMGSKFLQSKIGKKAEPTKVSDKTKARVAKAKVLSGSAVHISAGLVSSVKVMATAIGTTIASAVSETSTAKKVGKHVEESKSSKVGRAAKDIGLATLVALGTVWDGLDEAAKTLVNDGATATHGFVDHRYGAEAAATAKDALGVVKDVAETSINMKKIGTRALVRGSARTAAKQTLVKTIGPLDEVAPKEAPSMDAPLALPDVPTHAPEPVSAPAPAPAAAPAGAFPV